MDNVLINNLERPVSSDINVAQRLQGRSLAFYLKHLYSKRHTLQTENIPHATTIGLSAYASTNGDASIVLHPGVLTQDSSALAPTPLQYESSLRVGAQRDSLTIALPVPGGITWYLLEAQVQQVTTSSSRDIFDPASGNFVVTLVPKVRELGITTQWVAGTATALPTPSGGDWVMLAAFKVQTTGTIADITTDQFLLAPDVHTVRDSAEGWERFADLSYIRPAATPSVPATGVVALSVREAVTNANLDSRLSVGGRAMCFSTATNTPFSFTPTDAEFLMPGTTVSADTWYYLYLCPWNSSVPVSMANRKQRGILVLSAVAPESTSGFNNSGLVLPDPWGGYSVPAYMAPCVGALRRLSSNDGWVPMVGAGRDYTMIDWSIGTPTNLLVSASNPMAIPAAFMPAHAKTVKFSVSSVVSSSGDDNVDVWISETGQGGSSGAASRGFILLGAETNIDWTCEVPRHLAQEMFTRCLGGAPRTVSANALRITGFTV